MATKRKITSGEPLASIFGNASKKPCMTSAGTSLKDILPISESNLSDLPTSTLVEYIITLREAYGDVVAELEATKEKLSSTASKVKGNGEGAAMSAEELKKTTLTRDTRPSCKTSGKRWTYTSMVPNEEVFLKLFHLEPGKKEWKQKKLSLDDFQNITGELVASIRYGYLRITSKEINLKWEKDALSFTVSGLYGL